MTRDHLARRAMNALKAASGDPEMMTANPA